MAKTKSKSETEAVILELGKEGKKVKCKLRPVAGGTFVEIGGTKYLVGRKKDRRKKKFVDAGLWPLDSTGVTKKEFYLGNGLEKWARTAWETQRKVRLVIDVQGKKNTITKITLR